MRVNVGTVGQCIAQCNGAPNYISRPLIATLIVSLALNEPIHPRLLLLLLHSVTKVLVRVRAGSTDKHP